MAMLTREQRDRVITLRQAGVKIKDIAAITDIKKSTVGDYVAGKTYGNEYAEITGEQNKHWVVKAAEDLAKYSEPCDDVIDFDGVDGIGQKALLSEALKKVRALEAMPYQPDANGVYQLGDNIIVISDTHFPYQHPDTFEFLEVVKATYKITGAVHVGDVVDNHYPSYHEKEPDAYNGDDEIRLAREACQQLEGIFPQLLISSGNHDDLPKRKANSASVPLDWVSCPNQVYQLKGGWSWDSHHYFMAGENKVMLVHSVGANIVANAKRYSHSSVQGHHHSVFGVSYAADTDTVRWSMSVGCLINPKAPAFKYDKKQVLTRPILGCGVILKGVPITIPMVLDDEGRWIGRKV